MTNEDIIINLSQQLEAVAKRIGSLAEGITAVKEVNPNIGGDYETFLLDEVAHVQIIALELTEAVTNEGTGNGDESAFGPGELQDEMKGESESADEPPEKEDGE